MRRRLSIEIVSDVICPFCLIGARRLERAIAAREDLDVELVYRSFLLDPSTPPEGEELRGRLRRKYGDPEPMFRRVEELARRDGIPLDFSRVERASSTLGAHTLLRHARERGTQAALARALFAAYFLEGRDVGDASVLEQLAGAHGFAAGEARALLESEAEQAATRAEAQEMAERGIRGVPYVIVDGAIGISGAQPIEVFEAALERAAPRS
jgi:predicted DsbA family dithiol-disulfide isomerase